MKIADESKYSLKQDLKYGSFSIRAIIIVSLYFYLKGLSLSGFSDLNVSANITSWGFLFIAISGIISHFLMIRVKSYPVLFSFSMIAVLFMFLQAVGFGNRGHLLYLSILPFFMIYYIYLIVTSKLEKPARFDKIEHNLKDITHEGSLSGSCDGSIDLRLSQTVIFTKTFMYTVFLFSLVKSIADVMMN